MSSTNQSPRYFANPKTCSTWGSICACHIRFRGAWKVQGHSVDELPFKAMFGVYGSWFGVILVGLVLVAQFFIAVWYAFSLVG